MGGEFCNFEVEFLKFRPEARDRMNREFLSDPSYNYEAVNRASKACGPLVLWAIAQVRS